MPSNDKFFYINIRDYLTLGNDSKAGEPMLTRVLSGFSCPKNPDVERFLKNSAIEFTKKSQSVTYLVFSVENKGQRRNRKQYHEKKTAAHQRTGREFRYIYHVSLSDCPAWEKLYKWCK